MDASRSLEILVDRRALIWRWLACALLVGLNFIGNFFVRFNLGWLAGLITVAALNGTIVALLARRFAEIPSRVAKLSILLYTRISVDLLILFIAIRVTGGVESPFLFLLVGYLFVIDLESGATASLAASLGALLALGINAYLEFNNILPHLEIGLPFATNYSNPLFIYLTFALIATMVYFGLSNFRKVHEQLRAREKLLSKTMVELEQRVKELDALRGIGAQLTASLNLSALLEIIARSAMRLVQAYDVHIFLFDSSTGEFGQGVSVWADANHKLDLITPRPQGLTRNVAEKKMPLLIDDIEGHPLFSHPDARQWNLKSIGGFPLRKADRVVGVMNIAFQSPHTFTQDEERLLMALADHAALAIDNVALYTQVAERARELGALYETSRAASEFVPQSELLDRALVSALAVAQAQIGMVYLADEEGHLALAAQRGLSFLALEKLRGAPVHLENDLITLAFKTGAPKIARTEDDAAPQFLPGVQTEECRALAAIPLKVKDRALGVLVVAHRDRSALSEANARLLGTICSQVAVSLENLRLFDQSRRRAEELGSLWHIGLAMSATLDVREQLRQLHALVQKVIQTDTFFVGLYDEARNEIRIEFVIEEGWELRGPVLSADSAGLSSWVIQTGQPLHVHDLEKERSNLPVEPRHETRPARSWLGVPLFAHKRLVGILSVQSFKPNAFTHADEQFLSAVAQHAALALENARLFETAQRQTRELELLSAITRSVSATLNLNDVFLKTVRGLADNFGYPAVSLFRWQGDALVLRAQVGFEDRAKDSAHDSLVDRAARTGQVALHRGKSTETDFRTQPGVIKEIAAPIRIDKNVLGVLAVQVQGETGLTNDDMKIITAFADHLGAAIANAESFQAALERERMATFLQRISQVLAAAQETPKILDALCHESAQFFEVHAAYVWMIDGDEMRGVSASGDTRAEFLETRVPRSDPTLFSNQIIQERRALFLNRVEDSAPPSVLPNIFHAKSVLGAPLIVEEEPIGALMLVDLKNAARFGLADLERIERLASQATVALANARRNEQISRAEPARTRISSN